MAATNASLDEVGEDGVEEVVDIAGLPGQPLRLLRVQDLPSRIDRDALLRDDQVVLVKDLATYRAEIAARLAPLCGQDAHCECHPGGSEGT
mgnify:CR=1 FL=1